MDSPTDGIPFLQHSSSVGTETRLLSITTDHAASLNIVSLHFILGNTKISSYRISYLHTPSKEHNCGMVPKESLFASETY